MPGDNFPGFRLETVVDESGWGAQSAATTSLEGGRRDTFFSRLQLVVGPYNTYHVLDIAAKGTVRNKEVLTRTHYQQLADVDLQSFRELLEQWVLDYAELYSAAV